MEGQRYVAHAVPDGRVLLFAGSAALLIRSRDAGSSPLREFTPVAFVAHMPMVLITASESNATSVRQFVEQARAAPGRLHLGSAGELTISHLAGELFRRVTGTALERVSFNGGSAAVRGVITKQIKAAFVPLPAVLPYAANMRLRPLAIISAARHPAMKDVPTMDEAGVAGVDLSAWYGLFAPAATPRDVISRIHAALAPELQSAETLRLMLSQGLRAAQLSHEEFVELVRADSLRWAMLREYASLR
jgi:tripartite-type tricarboxylate transporter receptor subunit TctC